MSLTKEVVQDKIEVVGEYRAVQVRTATKVLENGVEISSSFSRKVIQPGESYADESTEVQAVCSAVHTAEVISAYNAYLASLEDEENGE